VNTINAAAKLQITALVLGMLLAAAPLVMGAPVAWDDGAGDDAWGTVAGGANTNWNGDVTPSAADSATINGAFNVDYDTALYGAGTELVGMTIGGGAGLNITNDMHVNGPFNIFNGAVTYESTGGTITQTAGDVEFDSLTDPDTLIFQGNGAGNSSIYNLSNGSLTLNRNINFTAIGGATGQFNMSGGVLNLATIGATGFRSGNNIFNFTGGTVNHGGVSLGGTLGGAGEHALIFDGSGSGLQMNFTNFNQSIGVGGGTVRVVGDATVDQLVAFPSINNSMTFGALSTYDVIINNAGDQFLELASSAAFGHNINLAGTLTVTDLSSAPVGSTFDILAVNTAFGAIVGDFTVFNLPPKFAVLDNGQIDGTYTIGIVPEPASVLLLMAGGLLGLRRRR